MTKRVLVIGDTHFPFHSRAALGSIAKIAKALKPHMVIQMGDLYDLYSFSRYPRSINLFTPDEELQSAREHAEAMWALIKKSTDKGTECFQIVGNHDTRVIKRMMDQMPAGESMVNDWFDKNYSFKGVKLIKDTEFVYDNVVYLHGFRSKSGDHARYNQCNTVVGHSHHGGVIYDAGVKGGYWELNAGFIGDIHAPVFAYSAQKRINKTTVGVGVVDEWGPRFIPLNGI